MTDSSTTKTSDLYSSPYLVDYYDIVAPSSDSVDDASFYWDVYQELQSLRSPTPNDPFIVMDVGTGTGRVIHGFATKAVELNAEFINTKFLGVDNAQHMLDKAPYITREFMQEHVQWVLGSALNLEDVMKETEHQYVDLLIFSIGSISHLSEPGQPETFLNQVSKVLRPDTGRAYVSIYDGSLLKKKENVAFHQPEGVAEIESKMYPLITYRESNHGGTLEGNVKYVKFDLEVLSRVDGEENILERNQVSMKMRQWGEDEIVHLAAGTGVSFVESKRGKHETFYVFKTEV